MMNKDQKNIIAIIIPIATFLISLKIASLISFYSAHSRNAFLLDRTWWIWLIWTVSCGYFEFKIFANDGSVFLSNIEERLNIFNYNHVKKGLNFILIACVFLILAFIPFFLMQSINYLFAYIYTVICYAFAYYFGENRKIELYWAFMITLFITPLFSFLIILTSPKLKPIESETRFDYIIRVILSVFFMTVGLSLAYSEGNISHFPNYEDYLSDENSHEKTSLSVLLISVGLFITGFYLIRGKRYFTPPQ